MDVHVRDLRYFAAVAEDLHFTRAAERLFVSQPALSKQIRMLERQIGGELFARDQREVSLTPLGAALLPHARRVLAEWDAGWAEAQRFKADQAATLIVGMSTSPGREGLLPAVRSRFTATHPEVTVRLRQVGWEDATAGLGDDSTDVAFLWLPIPGQDQYRWIVVAEEPRVLAMPTDHPLAAREILRIGELLDEPFLALPESAGPLRDYWLATEYRGGRAPVIGTQISNADETYEALLDGRGVVILATGNVPLLDRGGIVVRPIVDISGSQLALAWRRTDNRAVVRDYAAASRAVIQARKP